MLAAGTADYSDMVIFWQWGVRNVFAVLGLLATVAGAAAVVDWGLAFTALTFCYVLVRLANTFKRRAEIRERAADRRKQARVALATRLLAEEQEVRRAA